MSRRLPKLQDIWQVYAVIAVMFAGWTITAFLWKLSAWLLLLNLGEMLTLFAYAMAANFLESLIVLLLLSCTGGRVRKWETPASALPATKAAEVFKKSPRLILDILPLRNVPEDDIPGEYCEQGQ